MAFLQREGWNYNNIFDRVSGRFPEALPQSIRAAVSSGYDAALAADRMTQLEPDEKVLARYIPQGGGSTGGYRYYVTVVFDNPSTGSEDSRRMEVNSMYNLTREQVDREALEAFRQLVEGERDSPRAGELPKEPQNIRLMYLAFERS